MPSTIPRTLKEVRSSNGTYLREGSMVPSTVTRSMPAQYRGHPCFGTAIDVVCRPPFVALNRPFANHLSTKRPDGGHVGRRRGVSGASTLTIMGCPPWANSLVREVAAFGKASHTADAAS